MLGLLTPNLRSLIKPVEVTFVFLSTVDFVVKR